MGITKQGFKQLINTINVHHRRMIREPVHLTHESTADCLQKFGLDAPWITLQHIFACLETALHTRRCSLSGSMANQSHDICVLTPGYPSSDLTPPSTAHVQVTPNAPLQCPKCQRSFQQAGTLKRHLRHQHNSDCPVEDVYNPLRDSDNGTSTCAHCSRLFANMRILREHINKHSCSHFCATKGSIIPIAARPKLRMHLRHQSFQGLLLDQNLIAELAQHCAFCHQQIGPRAIARHYGEQHTELLRFVQPFKERMHWGGSLVGRGTLDRMQWCSMRR